MLACLMVACGELATMESTERRSEILQSLTPLGNRVVAKLIKVNQLTDDQVGKAGQTFADMLYDAARNMTRPEKAGTD